MEGYTYAFTSSSLSPDSINKGVVWSQKFILSLLLAGGSHKWLSGWQWHMAEGHVHPAMHPVVYPVASDVSNNANDRYIEEEGCRCCEMVLFHPVALSFSFYLIFYPASSTYFILEG